LGGRKAQIRHPGDEKIETKKRRRKGKERIGVESSPVLSLTRSSPSPAILRNCNQDQSRNLKKREDRAAERITRQGKVQRLREQRLRALAWCGRGGGEKVWAVARCRGRRRERATRDVLPVFWQGRKERRQVWEYVPDKGAISIQVFRERGGAGATGRGNSRFQTGSEQLEASGLVTSGGKGSGARRAASGLLKVTMMRTSTTLYAGRGVRGNQYLSA